MNRKRDQRERPTEDFSPEDTNYEAREAELYDEHGFERYPDHHQQELDRQESEALQTWRDNPEARAAFARQYGATEHGDWQGEIRRQETAAGAREGRDYGIEYVVSHPDGGNVRYDYVDLRSHQIVDRKPIHRGESIHDVAARYRHQRERHLEAYRHHFKQEADYYYSLYPSSKDIDEPME